MLTFYSPWVLKNGKQKKGTLRKNKIDQIIVHSILGSFEGKIFSKEFAHKKRGNNKWKSKTFHTTEHII